MYCAYLNDEVELTAEREQHILERHPDLWPEPTIKIAQTLADPDQIVRLSNSNERVFSRWFESIGAGKYVVVVVVSDTRHWIVTAYITRRLSKRGEIEWVRT